MEEFRHFLESSTIHGLQYISSSRKLFRVFWMCIVFAGFSGAGYMIYRSYKGWQDNPISTTIETKQMSDITFPKVTVCPPRDTYTNLNYDLMRAENITLDFETRTKFSEYATNIVQDIFFKKSLKKFKKLQEENRYLNWYLGLTEICFPTITDDTCNEQVSNKIVYLEY